MAAPDISYEDLCNVISEFVVIDVRNPEEVKKYGHIEGSHLIPLPQLENALILDPDVFKSRYDFDKPSSSSCIVTHCMKGARAREATNLLTKNGFTNVKCYAGSFVDWVAKGGKVAKPEK